MSELGQQYDLRPVPKNERGEMSLEEGALPDEVVLKMLKREVLLTRAKLHALMFEHIMGEKQLRSLKAQLRHNEPEFDRLKRELEEVKSTPRGLEGTYRCAAGCGASGWRWRRSCLACCSMRGSCLPVRVTRSAACAV